MPTLTAYFHVHDDVTESALTHVIRNPKAKYWVHLYFHDTIIARVASDAVVSAILVNNEATSISRAPRDVAFRKSLYKFIDSFALSSEYLNDF